MWSITLLGNAIDLRSRHLSKISLLLWSNVYRRIACSFSPSPHHTRVNIRAERHVYPLLPCWWCAMQTTVRWDISTRQLAGKSSGRIGQDGWRTYVLLAGRAWYSTKTVGFGNCFWWKTRAQVEISFTAISFAVASKFNDKTPCVLHILLAGESKYTRYDTVLPQDEYIRTKLRKT